MNTNQKIDHIRLLMKKSNIAAVIIPGNDPHQSEYVAGHWQERRWVTGFSGSAGTAVITLDQAILWTDFRYYIQAEQEMTGSEFKLYKMGEPDVPSFQKYLMEALKPGDIIGINANVFSMKNVKEDEEKFAKKGLVLNTDVDLVKGLWEDRPLMPFSKAYSFSKEYAGKSRLAKIKQIREKMDAAGAGYHLLATLDDISWTLNLRGKDVDTTPVNIAFVLIAPQKVSLFINKEKIDDNLEKELGQDGIDIAGYEDVTAALSEISDKDAILLDPENVNFSLLKAVNKNCKIIEKQNPAIGLKAVKNNVEINHLRDTAVKDGAAVVNFLYWLENQSKDTMDGQYNKISELSVADKLYQFRKAQDLFVDNSFDPIMAYQDHSAMCHYGATKKTDVNIGNKGMFLSDSGGNYLTGTTDITRTITRGEPSEQEIKDYTLVLKGHIAVASTLFPKGAKGFQIDTLARQHLWKNGMDFGHGTGHGVGFFLCVHEGPASISPRPLDVKLEKGMILTNEPGVYREGSYGIRLENMILVDKAFENEFGTFMKFENLTYCHFEIDLINKGMLSLDEKDWLNDYHSMVYDKVSPVLDKNVAIWLRKKTRSI